MTVILAEFQIQNLSTITLQQESSSTVDFFTVICSFLPFTVTLQGDTYEIPAVTLQCIPHVRLVDHNLTHLNTDYLISICYNTYIPATFHSLIYTCHERIIYTIFVAFLRSHRLDPAHLDPQLVSRFLPTYRRARTSV